MRELQLEDFIQKLDKKGVEVTKYIVSGSLWHLLLVRGVGRQSARSRSSMVVEHKKKLKADIPLTDIEQIMWDYTENWIRTGSWKP